MPVMTEPLMMGLGVALTVWVAVSLVCRLRRRTILSVLRESERQREVLLANLPGMAYRCRHDNRRSMEFISAGCLALTGYSVEAFIPSGPVVYLDLIDPEDLEDLRVRWDQAVIRKAPFSAEYRIRTRDGRRKWILDRAMPVFGEAGWSVAFEGIMLDITERRETEIRLRDLERMESLQRMAAAVGHHVNNAMATVIGNLELAILHGEADVSGDRPDITEALSAARRAAELGRRMLDWLGRDQDAKRSRMELGALIHRLIKELHLSIPSHIDIQPMPSTSPLDVYADANHVRRIIETLVNNAVESMTPVPLNGRLRIAWHERRPCDTRRDGRMPAEFKINGDRYACIEVSDTGPGIEARDRVRIFDPFYSTRMTGRGLGLALALSAVQAHHGCMEVDSHPGSGTVFRVFLPMEVSDAERTEASPVIPPCPAPCRDHAGDAISRVG